MTKLCYMAPLEGITGFTYRNAYHRCFRPMDKYFTPFISPAEKRALRTREMRDVAPENNTVLPLVPQILTNRADLFLYTCKELMDLGYTEADLNIGCPSGTVTARGKGAGALRDPDALEGFLAEIFDKAEMKLSVKMRIGWEDPSEFESLLPLLEKFPISELIIHPRVRQEFYKGEVHKDAFARALKALDHPLIFNGNLFTAGQIAEVGEEFPQAAGVMLGRGLIADPGLWAKACGDSVTKAQYKRFHDELYEGYASWLSGPSPLLHKMKELWCYMSYAFTGSEKYGREFCRVKTVGEYEVLVEKLFREEELAEGGFIPPNKKIGIA